MYQTDYNSVFNNLCTQLSNLVYGRSQTNRDQISKLLDEINKLDFRYPLVKNSTKAVLLVHQCCNLITTDDFNLVSKYCKLLTNLINRQHVQVEGQTLKLVTTWCIKALKDATQPVTYDLLLALEALLSVNEDVSEIILNSQFRSIISTIEKSHSPKVIHLAVQCLVLCTSTSKDNKDYLLQKYLVCADVFIKFLKEERNNMFDDLMYYKLLISCLRGLHNIVIQSQEYLNKELGLVLGICKSFMTFGIKGIDFLAVDRIAPSVLNVPEIENSISKEKRGGKVIKKRRPRAAQNKKQVNNAASADCTNDVTPHSSNFMLSSDDELVNSVCNAIFSSESDFSDAETSKAARLDITQSRIRQAALDLLLYVVKKTDKNTIFTYWSVLIPDGSTTYGTHHITSCFLRDPSPRGRMAALKVLLALLINCKAFLAMAESSEKNSPFTSFSGILGSMLKELHRCLSLGLHENSNTVLIQVLKCLAALVQATPYHKLTPGIITKIMRNVKVYITHKDATVEVAALIVLGYILGSEPTVPETKTALLKHLKDFKFTPQNPSESDFEHTDILYDNDDDYDDNVETDTQELPWLLEKCLNNLGVYADNTQTTCESVAAPVKLESLQVLTAMTKNCFDYLLVPYLTHVTKALEICLCDSYCDLRLHTGRTIDFLGQAISLNLNVIDHSKPLSVGQGLIFWQTLLSSSLVELLRCEEHWVLRAVGCDCLGSIGSHIFEHLPKNQQILIMTLLVGCSRDEEINVRAAAVRALAICVVYTTLREDTGFVADVAEAIYRTLQEEHLVARIKASWSLGNLSDALVLNMTDNIEAIPDNLLLRLLELSIKCCSDNTKIKVNAVRALGNLLQLITAELIEQKVFKNIIDDAFSALVKILTSGTDVKLKWNCCYAVGSVYKNPVLLTTEERKQLLFAPLMDLLMTFRNFKVRINAALAFSCPGSREMYGQYYIIIWDCLLKALENAQNVEDFNEYNHRDHLVEQICLTLAHMTSLLTIDDLLAIKEKTLLHANLFQQKMHHTVEGLIPEKSSVLLSAVSHLNALMNLTSISEEHKEMLSVLQTVFTNPLL